jgi:hypothetical protein
MPSSYPFGMVQFQASMESFHRQNPWLFSNEMASLYCIICLHSDVWRDIARLHQ